MHSLGERGRRGRRANMGAQQKSRTRRGFLEHVEIDYSVVGLTNVVKFRVSHYSDDLVALVISVERNSSSDRTAIREIVAGHGLIDDGHARAALVAQVEVAPGQ